LKFGDGYEGGNRMTGNMRIYAVVSILVLLTGVSIFISACGEEKVIIRYREIPEPVDLIAPPNDTLIHENNPTFSWHSAGSGIRYQLQVSTADNFISKSINVEISDTVYTTLSSLINGSFFWRVRSNNQDGIWGDWSDADIRIFYKTDNVFYIPFKSSINTIGTANDVVIRNDTAYVADGAADVTMIDVFDKENPAIIQNIDTFGDDYARSVYINPRDTVPYAFVADLDGRIQVLNTLDPEPINHSGFGDQNMEDISAVFISDTLYMFGVRSASGFNPAGLQIFQILYQPNLPPNPGPWPWNPIDTPADALGIFSDTAYAYIACDVVGLIIVDLTDIYNPYIISSLDLEGSSTRIFARNDYVYMAADRAGLYVIDATVKTDPVIASLVNTSGRTKDVHVVGDYAFIADASGGLKVMDVSVPDSAHFIAAYSTPYALGVYADSGYVYICDRDEGLMIFENLVVE
jgi:hypothetical protein